MATCTFYIRSKEGDKTSIYYRIRNGRNFAVPIRTPYSVDPKKWNASTQRQENPYTNSPPRNPEGKQDKKAIEHLNNNLTLFDADFQNYYIIHPTADKDQIKKYFQDKYFPKKNIIAKKKKVEDVSNFFSDCVLSYIADKSRRIEGKQKPISEPTRKKLITIKNTVHKFNSKLKLSQIDDDFRDDYTIYMQEEKYSPSTIIKDLKYISSICKHHSKKLKVHTDVLTWKFIKTKKPYTDPVLSLAEIEKIKSVIYPHDYLDNAKDWLIIGLNTGARIDNLLKFDAADIIDGNLLAFRQNKIEHQTTNPDEVIYLNPEVIEILQKRGGNFPRKIADQNFNLYIKEVCKIAGFNEKMIGGKIDPATKKKKIGEYEKWELVASHIMRRSYVTNHSRILGKDELKGQTGHRTDEMVDLYDKTEKIDRAKRLREKMEEIYNNNKTDGK